MQTQGNDLQYPLTRRTMTLRPAAIAFQLFLLTIAASEPHSEAFSHSPAPLCPPRTARSIRSQFSPASFGHTHTPGPPRRGWFPLLSGQPEEGERSGGAPGGDRFRSASGIRPSLHPTTINAISEALSMRSSPESASSPVDVWADGAKPLDVALTASKIAADALERRSVGCKADGDEGSSPTPEECQVLAGRVVGVVMRLRQLERDLAGRVGGVGWVEKYGEHGTFGVLKGECDAIVKGKEEERVGEGEEGAGGPDGNAISIDMAKEAILCERIRDDPLFCMCRAECLLALFMINVEIPTLEKVGQEVPGGSKIDFIDEDRMGVLLS